VDAITGFFRFWYDFIIGDDWIVAAAVALTLVVLLALRSHDLWWPLPIVVIAILGVSLWRATRA
jgi:hypothetical protein